VLARYPSFRFGKRKERVLMLVLKTVVPG
jgi:hypothetical protein